MRMGKKASFAYLYSERGVVERLVILESILHDLFGQRLEEHAIVNSETRQQHAYVTCKD
jgi:Mg2+/Co2+ transporter CorB